MKLYFSIIIFILITLSNQLMAGQKSFATAEKAADTLYQAIETKNNALIKELFGIDNTNLLHFGEVDEQDIEQFIRAWNTYHKLVSEDHKLYYIEIGTKQWTFPIPLIKQADSWQFDITSGIENINIRRIGRNELATIQTVLAYYDAQLEYAEQDRNNDGILQYAQKFRSTTGKKDGLYWPVKPGEPLSPLGSLLENKTPQTAYNGYYYKILTSQGNYADGGALNYIIGKRMSAGFALLAWPSEYGKSGVTSFMINHKGVVYEKDLGTETQQKAASIVQFDPDSSWKKTQ